MWGETVRRPFQPPQGFVKYYIVVSTHKNITVASQTGLLLCFLVQDVPLPPDGNCLFAAVAHGAAPPCGSRPYFLGGADVKEEMKLWISPRDQHRLLRGVLSGALVPSRIPESARLSHAGTGLLLRLLSADDRRRLRRKIKVTHRLGSSKTCWAAFGVFCHSRKNHHLPMTSHES